MLQAALLCVRLDNHMKRPRMKSPHMTHHHTRHHHTRHHHIQIPGKDLHGLVAGFLGCFSAGSCFAFQGSCIWIPNHKTPGSRLSLQHCCLCIISKSGPDVNSVSLTSLVLGSWSRKKLPRRCHNWNPWRFRDSGLRFQCCSFAQQVATAILTRPKKTGTCIRSWCTD